MYLVYLIVIQNVVKYIKASYTKHTIKIFIEWRSATLRWLMLCHQQRIKLFISHCKLMKTHSYFDKSFIPPKLFHSKSYPALPSALLHNNGLMSDVK